VGVLVAVGRGQLGLDEIGRLIAGASERAAPLTAPASGLFLERVYYEGDPPPAPQPQPAWLTLM
jgi:tRNA pseudouridine38-40 synthase